MSIGDVINNKENLIHQAVEGKLLQVNDVEVQLCFHNEGLAGQVMIPEEVESTTK